jgi:hypothetical protein
LLPSGLYLYLYMHIFLFILLPWGAPPPSYPPPGSGLGGLPTPRPPAWGFCGPPPTRGVGAAPGFLYGLYKVVIWFYLVFIWFCEFVYGFVWFLYGNNMVFIWFYMVLYGLYSPGTGYGGGGRRNLPRITHSFCFRGGGRSSPPRKRSRNGLRIGLKGGLWSHLIKTILNRIKPY